MEYTQNYQLPLWDADDPIKRTDFNDTNSKIEAALAEVKKSNLWVKLLDMTLTEEQHSVDLDVSTLDLKQYQRLEMRIVGSASGYTPVYMRLNGLTSDYYSRNNNSTSGGSSLFSFAATEQPSGVQIDLYLFGAQVLCRICGAAWDSNTIYFSDSLSSIKSNILAAQDIHTINLITHYESVYLQPGTQITLLALKK